MNIVNIYLKIKNKDIIRDYDLLESSQNLYITTTIFLGNHISFLKDF